VFASNLAEARFPVSLDGGGARSVQSPDTALLLADGTHELDAYAVDERGGHRDARPRRSREVAAKK
jgi:hypothetical protein